MTVKGESLVVVIAIVSLLSVHEHDNHHLQRGSVEVEVIVHRRSSHRQLGIQNRARGTERDSCAHPFLCFVGILFHVCGVNRNMPKKAPTQSPNGEEK